VYIVSKCFNYKCFRITKFTMSPTSEITLLERNLAAATKALGEEVSRLQDVVLRKKDGWKEAQDARGRAEDALKQAKTTWARADNEVERWRGGEECWPVLRPCSGL
jgi:hypothetical protein